MAITIQAKLAKTLPIPGSQFSSQQASITITAEVTDLNQVVTEAQRLYSLAEQAVDAQLNQSASSRLLAQAKAVAKRPTSDNPVGIHAAGARFQERCFSPMALSYSEKSG